MIAERILPRMAPARPPVRGLLPALPVTMAAAFIMMMCATLLAPGAAAQSGDTPPVFDPLRAEKSIEVGMYYFKKKNYDAAIDRFKEALTFKPNFARAHLLIAQSHDKKKERPEAIAAYRKYLEIVPNAPDAGKVRQRIERLEREIEREAQRRRRSG